MKAAVPRDFGKRLFLEDVKDPVSGSGEVLQDVVAAPVLSYADEELLMESLVVRTLQKFVDPRHHGCV